MTMKKWIAIIVLFVFFAYMLWEHMIERQTVTTGIQIGMKAPDFSLETIDGKTVQLSQFHGKIVIVNFWATWCPPCRAEMPDMQTFYEKYHNQVEIVAVNVMVRDSREKVSQFIKDYRLTFPVVLDVDGHVMKQYEIQPIPTSFIIDRQGMIREKQIGPMSYEQMVQYVEKWGK
ncbi:redoxin domain-containing protein [Anoxybacillus sp. ST4]|uniref:TlpA family protein disulfide reductase n=1 Tax=Anoxybacillus sp. ST4 TaxID=2864181 RepID=UPI001C63E02C|nr:redoxin domain-containing protein [Anoxybacillus sp. ST4]MBW7652049.1 redoxin domain-containing protein [Anoxybacillus sp. ST4]